MADYDKELESSMASLNAAIKNLTAAAQNTGNLNSDLKNLQSAVQAHVAVLNKGSDVGSKLSTLNAQLSTNQGALLSQQRELQAKESNLTSQLAAVAAGAKKYTYTNEDGTTKLKDVAKTAKDQASQTRGLTQVIEDQKEAIQVQVNETSKLQTAIAEIYQEQQNAAVEFNRVSSSLKRSKNVIDLFNNNTPAGKMLVLGELAMRLGKAFGDLREAIYKVQSDVGVQIGSASRIYGNALISRAKSLVGLTDGPVLDTQEIINATANFKKEFGTILDPAEAEKIAGEAKRLGVSSEDYVKAKRAFLGTGAAEDVVRQKAIAEFQKQGLAGADAIQFAAQNADLLAVAGGKYAESLFRAAAESRKIGVNLRDIEKFANSIVGDFEGSLENFAELSALGVEMDFNQLAQVAATGTTEDLQNLLQQQLSVSGITGEELQTNRQLRLALTQTTGFDESTILKLAGVAQAPKEKTVEEQQLGYLERSVELLQGILTAMGGLAGAVVGLKALGFAKNIITGGKGITGLLPGLGGAPAPTVPPTGLVGGGGLSGVAGGAASFSQSKVIQGAAAMLVVAASVYVLGKGLQQFSMVNWSDMGKAAVALGVLTVAAFGLSFIAPQVGVGALAIAALGASIIPFGIALRIMAPGLSTFGQFITTLSQLNAGQVGILALMGPALTSMAVGLTALGIAAIAAAPGLAVLGGLQKIGLLPTFKSPEKTASETTTPIPNTKVTSVAAAVKPTTIAASAPIESKVDTAKLEAKLDQVITAIRSMKIEMNGYEVGHVTANEARTPLRTR